MYVLKLFWVTLLVLFLVPVSSYNSLIVTCGIFYLKTLRLSVKVVSKVVIHVVIIWSVITCLLLLQNSMRAPFSDSSVCLCVCELPCRSTMNIKVCAGEWKRKPNKLPGT